MFFSDNNDDDDWNNDRDNNSDVLRGDDLEIGLSVDGSSQGGTPCK